MARSAYSTIRTRSHGWGPTDYPECPNFDRQAAAYRYVYLRHVLQFPHVSSYAHVLTEIKEGTLPSSLELVQKIQDHLNWEAS